MGWRILTNNKNQWNIFSSITDGIIGTFETQEELVKYIATKRIYDGKLQAIESLMTFPANWTVNDEIQWSEELSKKTNEFYEWQLSISGNSKTLEEYHQRIDDKLNELLG